MAVYVAVLADVIASRELAPARRARLQADLRAALPELNRRWQRRLAARFALTLGDELQGLLHDPAAVWDLSHDIRHRFAQVDWVIACGRGPLTTRLVPGARASELDGPCFHAARAALERAKDARLILAFEGFAEPRLSGLAAYYSALYWSWTARQRRAAIEWRAPAAGREAPRARGRDALHPSALSHLRRRMAWRLVESGDTMFRALLEAAR